MRSDGDSSHAAVPGGTPECYKRLTKLTGFYPALPAPRTGMCDCHTALHTSAALTAPHKWSWWQILGLHVAKLRQSALAKLIPKGQHRNRSEIQDYQAQCSALSIITGLYKWRAAWLKPVSCYGCMCSKLLQVSNTYPHQKAHMLKK